MTLNHTFAARLTYTIERSGQSEEDVAKRAGISVMTLQHYTKGRRKPSMKNLVKLNKALNTDLGWLVTGK